MAKRYSRVPDALIVDGEGLRGLNDDSYVALVGLLRQRGLSVTPVVAVNANNPIPLHKDLRTFMPIPEAESSKQIGSFSFDFAAYRDWADAYGEHIRPNARVRLLTALRAEAANAASEFVRQVGPERFTVMVCSWPDLANKLSAVKGVGTTLFNDFCGFVYDSMRMPQHRSTQEADVDARIRKNPFVARTLPGVIV